MNENWLSTCSYGHPHTGRVVQGSCLCLTLLRCIGCKAGCRKLQCTWEAVELHPRSLACGLRG